METLSKWILYVFFTCILLVVGCEEFLWWDYQNNQYNPCAIEGERMKLDSYSTIAPAGSNYGAMCVGFTKSGHRIRYSAR